MFIAALAIAGELFFMTDRQNGFWNLYKWVSFLSHIRRFVGYFLAISFISVVH